MVNERERDVDEFVWCNPSDSLSNIIVKPASKSIRHSIKQSKSNYIWSSVNSFDLTIPLFRALNGVIK